MNKQKLMLLCTALLCASVIAGCGGGGGGNTPPQSGFKAQGEGYVQNAGGGFTFLKPVNIQGDWLFDNGSAVGNTLHFGPILCIGGPCQISDGRVPARWRIIPGVFGECTGILLSPLDQDVSAGQTVTGKCLIPGILFLNASPSSIDLQAPPATVDLTGGGFSAAYGMPRIEYYDQNTGAFVASTIASSVAPDGAWLQSNTPDLSSVFSGTYNIVVSNLNADGSAQLVGVATVDAWGRDGVYVPPPDPGSCGCPPDGPCMPCSY